MRQDQQRIRSILIAVVVFLATSLGMGLSLGAGSGMAEANVVAGAVSVHERDHNGLAISWVVWRFSSDGTIHHRRVSRKDDDVSDSTSWTPLAEQEREE